MNGIIARHWLIDNRLVIKIIVLKPQISDPLCPNNNTHTVVVIGYGVECNKSYWLAKNSWGKDHGSMGFFKIKRGTGHCGIGDYQLMPLCRPN